MLNIDVQVHPRGRGEIDKDGNDDNNGVHSINDGCYKNYEFVLVVPQKLTKHAQNVIYLRQVTPLRYHLEGRFGSRTHRIDESHMGLPLTTLVSLDESKAQLVEACIVHEDLRSLVSSEGVKFYYKPYYEPAPHKARSPPYVDARIHPEREPAGRGDSVFFKNFMRVLKSESGPGKAEEFNRDIQTAASSHYINHLSLNEGRAKFTYAELFAGKPYPEVLSDA